MLLKSSRSTRWPYLFRSTVLGGAELEDFERTTWNSPELGGFPGVEADVGTLMGAPLVVLVTVVLVDVRERGTACWIGDGVSKDRGFVVTAAFQDDQTGAIFAVRNISGNWVTL